MSKKDSLGAALVGLRQERGAASVEVKPRGKAAKAQERAAAPARPAREAREAFTSRLKPSQRRWLKRWVSDLEEETGQRVTLEDVLEAFAEELQENEALRVRLVARILEEV